MIVDTHSQAQSPADQLEWLQMIDSNITKLTYLIRLQSPMLLTCAPPSFVFNEPVICCVPADLIYFEKETSPTATSEIRTGRLLVLWENLCFQVDPVSQFGLGLGLGLGGGGLVHHTSPQPHVESIMCRVYVRHSRE